MKDSQNHFSQKGKECETIVSVVFQSLPLICMWSVWEQSNAVRNIKWTAKVLNSAVFELVAVGEGTLWMNERKISFICRSRCFSTVRG